MPSRKHSYHESPFEGTSPPDSIVFESKMLINWAREISNSWRLSWRLFTSNQVPLWKKAIPVFSILYWLSPFDFALVPIIGFTPLDDILVLYFGLKLFVELCPRSLVDHLRHEINYGSNPDDSDAVIDTTYEILDDE